MSIEYLLPICAILSGLWIAYQDLRTQQISTRLLMGFGVLSVGNFFLKGPHITDFLGLGIIIMLIALIFLYERLKEKNLLGAGDKILLICCCGWVSADQIPFLLIFTGILGVITAGTFRVMGRRTLDDQDHQGKTFPFAPAILLALLILRFL